MTAIREVMTPDPVVLGASQPIRAAAEMMRDRDIGNVLVQDGDGRLGIVTDRDLVVRGLADGREQATLRELCSERLVGVPADADVGEAVAVMREHAVRRLPVVDADRVVGMVSIGDLAQAQDERSALADISNAPPNT